jgi:signal transduction histidine kinase
MSGLSAFQLLDAGVHFGLALVWAIVAQNAWRFLRTQHPRSRFFTLLPIEAGAVAFAYCTFTVIALIPPDLRQQRPFGVILLFAFHDWCNFTIVALGRHLARYFPDPDAPASRAWLAVNYGSVLLMAALTAAFLGQIRLPFVRPGFATYVVVRMVYQLVMLGSIVWQMVRIARPGVWEPGGGAWVARRADVVFLGGALVTLAGWLLIALTTDRAPEPTMWHPSTRGLVLDTIAGVGFAVPLAVRILGEVVRGLLLMAVTLAATVAVYAGVHQLGASLAGPEVRSVLDLGAVLALVALMIPGQSWLRGAIDHVVFRRSRRRRDELQAFLHTLSPDLGASECCQRAVVEAVRVMRLRGAAILLRDGAAVVHGAISFMPLERLWRETPADAFPAHALVGYELREVPVPLREALRDSDVVGLLPITSPRQHWGLLLISTSLLGAAFSDEDERGLVAFGDQLARVLDGADLLARAVAVERSLAHSEKLAAIGELAARVAHEIRNPVTAARSLAQQLARDPVSPLNAEHAGLIVAELERVERQVAALLRFARRDEFHFEPVDLSELAAETVDAFRSRLDASGIGIESNMAHGVIVRGDRDKIRHVLINLFENALDALAAVSGTKQLSVTVTATDGVATLEVRDSGPGVPAQVLPQLFEPFFSLKPAGTGLGLAIAKRTVDAHGGRITAAAAAGAGMTVSIVLPLTAGT